MVRFVNRKEASSQDREVVKGFLTAVKKIYGSAEEASKIRSQFSQFARGRSIFASHDSKTDGGKKKDPIDWWWLHGVDAPELQQFAIRLLGQVVLHLAFVLNLNF